MRGKLKASNPFSEDLPVLDAIIETITIKGGLYLEEVAFVCVQHLLYTTFSLLKALIRLGASPDNIHVMGKPYSSCSQVIDKLVSEGYHYYLNSPQVSLGGFACSFTQDIKAMWQSIFENLQQKKIRFIIILDDGGNCLINVPSYIIEKYSLIGVEQTISGLNHPLINHISCPLIEVASSAAKQLVESPMIAEAVSKKVSNIFSLSEKRLSCAVVGLGVIGYAITQKLLSLNHHVITYDKNPEKNQLVHGALRAPNLETLIYEADYIFGCSGEDITETLDVNLIKKNKMFISCSSQDKEFLSLLKLIQKNNNYTYNGALEHICYPLEKDVKIEILRGGFPINFDSSGKSVETCDIQLTRGLLLGGILQAILCVSQARENKKNTHYMLDPYIQAFVVSNWHSYGSPHLINYQLLPQFRNIEWIKKHSKGFFQEDKNLSYYFNVDSALIDHKLKKTSQNRL